ncbi:MAG: bifunctional adenosylcobinamide kinase/adenosylcobinamide-phosphate guanylyltransferase [Acidimicrobiaceae bacterium]|nr:bifunctional adenosylcobinamide kinase/adenosylcobinamide-phosphate guanylyltransferase [Acidimicrobiaceae bacterium]
MTGSPAHLTVLLGGARAGKSTFAERLAATGGEEVAYLATSPRIEGDADLDARIARHRADRPDHWITIEEEIDVAAVLRDATEGVVLLDCLTTWVGNLLHVGRDEGEVLAATDAAIDAATTRSGPTIVVTNEVGLGVIPPTELGRAYRDLLGRVNQRWVAASDRALLIVAGRALPLHDPESLG